MWDKPEEPNGPIESYILKGACAKSECVKLQLNGTLNEYAFESDVNPESFQILAKNSDSLVGKPARINLPKKPFKPIPKLLTLDSSNVLEVMNLANNQKDSLHHLSWTPELFSFNAVNNEIIMLSQHQNVFQMDVETRIIKDTGIIMADGDGPKVFDSISQSIYWSSKNEIHRLSIEIGEKVKIGFVSDIIEELALSTQDNSIMFYATINGDIGALNLTNGINYDIRDNCHLDGLFLTSMAASGRNLYFIEKSPARAWIFDVETKSCLFKGNLPSDLAVADLTILNDEVFWLNTSSNQIWSLQNGEYHSEVTIIKLTSFCSTCQSLPEVHKKCFHHHPRSGIQVSNVTSSSASFQIPSITSECDIILPLPKIVIILNESSTHEFIMNNPTNGMVASLDNLAPSTKYIASVLVRNDLGYFDMNQTLTFETSQGPPNPPKDLEVLVLSPKSLQVSWKAVNSFDVSYEVHYMVENVINVTKISNTMVPKRIRKFQSTQSVTIKDLDPNTEYHVWIEARNSDGKVTKSSVKVVSTMQPPNLVQLLNKGPRFMRLEWKAPEADVISQHQIVIESANGSIISIPELPHTTQAKQSYTYNVSDLNPGTDYFVSVLVIYKTSVKGVHFKWPIKKTPNMITTLPGKPLTPGQPYPLESLSEAKIFMAWKPNDASVTLYQLQYMEISNQSYASNWSTLYEDSQTKWQISGLTDGLIQFRVRAKNPFGWSEWSEESIPIDVEKILLQLSSQQSQVGLIVGGSFTGFALLVIIFILFTLSLKYGNSEKKALLGLPSASIDHQELAVMR